MKTRAAKQKELDNALLLSKSSEMIERLRSHKRDFKQEELLQHDKVGRASVLVPLFVDRAGGKDELCVVLTLRSKKLKSHPGEVCLPGGREESQDLKDPIKTAIRECEEETGIGESQIKEILTILDPSTSRNFLIVTPVVALIKSDYSLKLNRTEVEEAFTVPLRVFVQTQGYRFEDIPWRDGRSLRLHVFEYDKFTIWGLTARLLIHVAMVAFGLEAPPFLLRPLEERRSSLDQVREDIHKLTKL